MPITFDNLLEAQSKLQRLEGAAEWITPDKESIIAAVLNLAGQQCLSNELEQILADSLSLSLAQMAPDFRLRLAMAAFMLRQLDQAPSPDPQLMALYRSVYPRLLLLMLLDADFARVPKSLTEQFLDVLYQLSVCLNRQEPAAKILLQGLEQLLNKLQQIELTDFEDFAALFGRFQSLFAQQLQRCALLEKRSLEAEAGKLRLNLAKQLTDQLLKPLLNLIRAYPQFNELFDIHLRQVLILHLLREQEDNWLAPYEVIQLICLSLQPLDREEDYKALKKVLPKLIAKLKMLLSDSGIGEQEKETLFNQLAKIHSKKLKQMAEQFGDVHGGSDIIRLKPLNHHEDKSDTAKSNRSPKQQLLATFYRFNPEIKAIIKKTLTEYRNSLQSDDRAEPLLEENRWYLLPMALAPQAVKLACIIHSPTRYCFVSITGTLVCSVESDEIAKLIKDKTIKQITVEGFCQQSCALFLSRRLFEIQQAMRQQGEEHPTEHKPVVPEIKVEQTKKASSEKTEQRKVSPVDLPKDAILHLRVGGWIEYDDNESVRRCRLAARISEGTTFIFTNRLGQRILTLDKDTLLELYQCKRIKILDAGDIEKKDHLQDLISQSRHGLSPTKD